MPNTCYFVTVHTFDHFISWKPTVCKELHVPDAKGTILKWDTWWGPPGQLEWETRCSLDSWVSEITSLSPWTTSKWGTRRKIKIREGHLGPQRTRAVIWKEIIWTLLKNAWICLWGRGKVLHQKQLCRCPAFSSSLCPRHTSLFSVTPWANFFFSTWGPLVFSFLCQGYILLPSFLIHTRCLSVLSWNCIYLWKEFPLSLLFSLTPDKYSPHSSFSYNAFPSHFIKLHGMFPMTIIK